MNEVVKHLWEGTEATVRLNPERKEIAEGAEPPRAVHTYARSQCRSTHKRQDC